ncbi:MAG: sporulation protein YqfD, partial [Firmicutes bacterium]|nr:sporulation protein YqfD [Bacillota bacterium]
NYLHGYVIIKITGFSVERFINLSVLNGVFMWDIKNDRSGRIMNIRMKDLETVYMCAEKTNCRIEVLSRCGLRVSAEKLGARKIFSAGVVAFSFILFLSTRFIWVVEAEGNKTVSSEKLLEFCEENGVAPGRLKYKADLKELSRKIILNFEEVSWAAANINGSRVVISVAENIKNPEKNEKGIFVNNIIAEKDGIVESIMVESGTADVEAGDVVEEGDILIKGEIILRDGETESGRKYENAEGEVKAKTEYLFRCEAERNKTEKIYTGEVENFSRITINEREFVLFKPQGVFDSETKKEFCFGVGDFKLPVKAETMLAKFYNEKETYLTEEETEKVLQTMIEEKKEEILSGDAVITEENTSVSRNESCFIAETRLLVIEDIAIKTATKNKRGEFVTDGSQ